MLDIQASTGKGSLFWHQEGEIKGSTCVDFSDYLISLSQKRLENCGLDFKCVKIADPPLPFANEQFDFICSYEMIEHVYEYQLFLNKIERV